jgi:peptidoglycan/xylan/chitin deacetylase (PgdA/CDA1 family)
VDLNDRLMHPLAPFASTNLVVPFHEVPSPRWFREALDSLARFYRFVDMPEIEACATGRAAANSLCHVTFDDGHESFYRYALPILRERRIPATLFVSPKVMRERSNYWFQDFGILRERLGDAPIRTQVAATLGCSEAQLSPFSLFSVFVSLPVTAIHHVLDAVRRRHALEPSAPCNMTVDELRESAASGVVTVGAHTINHPVLANETAEQAEAEIRDSINELADVVDRRVDRFAYPNGTEGLDFSEREEQLAAKYGISAAVTTDVGFVRSGTRPLALPRGGCPSLEGDTPFWRLARLTCLPAWDRIRQLAHPRRLSQADERRAIRALGIADRGLRIAD